VTTAKSVNFLIVRKETPDVETGRCAGMLGMARTRFTAMFLVANAIHYKSTCDSLQGFASAMLKNYILHKTQEVRNVSATDDITMAG